MRSFSDVIKLLIKNGQFLEFSSERTSAFTPAADDDITFASCDVQEDVEESYTRDHARSSGTQKEIRKFLALPVLVCGLCSLIHLGRVTLKTQCIFYLPIISSSSFRGKKCCQALRYCFVANVTPKQARD